MVPRFRWGRRALVWGVGGGTVAPAARRRVALGGSGVKRV